MVIDKSLSELTCAGKTLTVKLSQEDTLKLQQSEFKPAEVQIRVRMKSGDALASDIMRLHVEVIKNDGTSKVYETNKSYFYTSRQDEFIMEGMDGAKVKVRAYGENDTFGVWSEKKEVSGVDSTGGVEVHTVDIPYQGKTERSYFYAQN